MIIQIHKLLRKEDGSLVYDRTQVIQTKDGSSVWRVSWNTTGKAIMCNICCFFQINSNATRLKMIRYSIGYFSRRWIAISLQERLLWQLDGRSDITLWFWSHESILQKSLKMLKDCIWFKNAFNYICSDGFCNVVFLEIWSLNQLDVRRDISESFMEAD